MTYYATAMRPPCADGIWPPGSGACVITSRMEVQGNDALGVDVCDSMAHRGIALAWLNHNAPGCGVRTSRYPQGWWSQ
jgi:hypothetical protein